mmetsp:Transcript_76596/g.215432  ORF Transcript_76596/g.215432 Transcript_76596/m.215432 type:complete len:233 (+) Transcript_76596:644-1342(+)
MPCTSSWWPWRVINHVLVSMSTILACAPAPTAALPADKSPSTHKRLQSGPASLLILERTTPPMRSNTAKLKSPPTDRHFMRSQSTTWSVHTSKCATQHLTHGGAAPGWSTGQTKMKPSQPPADAQRPSGQNKAKSVSGTLQFGSPAQGATSAADSREAFCASIWRGCVTCSIQRPEGEPRLPQPRAPIPESASARPRRREWHAAWMQILQAPSCKGTHCNCVHEPSERHCPN